MIQPANAFFLLSIWIAVPISALSEAAPRISAPEVVGHLEQTIAWYHSVIGVAGSTALPLDILQRDKIRRDALNAVRLGFDFARAEATLLARQSSAAPDVNATARASRSQNLQQAAARASARVTIIQSQINQIQGQLPKAPPRSRPVLIAQRDELQAELDLAKQVEATVQSLLTFAGAQELGRGAAGELTAEINQLERSVPEATGGRQPSSPPPTASSPAPAPAQIFHPESAGIFALFGELFTLTHGRSQLSDAINSTDQLLKSVDRIRAPLVNQLRQSIQQSESLARMGGSSNPQQLAAGEREIASITASFKQLSSVVIPLGEQGIALATSRGDLMDLRNTLTEQYGATGRYLLLRLGVLIVVIVAVLIVSEFWRRISFRYIRDPHRRRQFLALRRVVVASAIVLVLVLSFVTEFGSLATYAGLLTAGIAVALQNVILSVVAYFFLIGRYGVRVGDRVTISGVTGNVIDIGLIRIYLMELVGSGAELHSTGRIVVFSNSVFFQPSALFKQMPGTDYVWHTVKLALTPDSDFQLAQNHLAAAVDEVYEPYRERIETQHAAFARSVDVQMSAPRPECRLRFTDDALEVLVQYPVPIQNASQADEQIMKALYNTIAREPKLKLMPSGAPQLVAA